MSTNIPIFFRHFQHFHNFYFVFLCNMHPVFHKIHTYLLSSPILTVPHVPLFHAFSVPYVPLFCFSLFFRQLQLFQQRFHILLLSLSALLPYISWFYFIFILYMKKRHPFFSDRVSLISVLLLFYRNSRKMMQNSVIPCFVIFRYFLLFGRSHPQSAPSPQSSFRQSCG